MCTFFKGLTVFVILVATTAGAGNDIQETAPDVNIWHLMGGSISDFEDLFGNKVGFNDIGMHDTHYFDTGLQIGVDSGRIVSIRVDYNQVDSRFHFEQISGNSTYDDVVIIFGSEPDGIRRHYSDPHSYHPIGATFSYGYYVGGNVFRFVRFFFNDDKNVVAIVFFV